MDTVTKPWHEDDTFWNTFSPEMFGTKRWEAAAGEAEQVIALLKLAPGAAVLDLCCGPGRHALEFARRGFRVTGVDRTDAYLQEAQRRAEPDGLTIEWVLEDMRRFRRPAAFDGAINLFTAFGYFEDPDDDRRVLENVHASLKPGGTLVMDMMGKEILARVFCPSDWHEHDGVYMLQERKVAQNWSWIENRWILFKNQQRHEYRVDHRLYSATELSALIKQCGFGCVTIYGDLAGAPYDHQAKRLVAVALKV